MLTFKPMIPILASTALAFSLGCSGGSSGTNAGGSSGGGGTTPTVPIKKVFVLDHDTSGDLKTEGGGSSGPDGGDRLCQADSQSSGGVYKAMVVDGVQRVACTTADCSGGTGEHVDWVFASNTKYVRADDGVTEIGVTNDKGLFDFPLTNEWAVSGVDLWTGLNGDWTTATHTCSGYTSSGAFYSTIGHPSAKDASAISASTYSCSYYSTTLLCVEQ
jgi:hypothetical protein